MSHEKRAPRRNAGAFMGPGGTFPAAMRTLSDEIPGVEPDPVETVPEPEPPGLVRRLVERLTRRRPSDDG